MTAMCAVGEFAVCQEFLIVPAAVVPPNLRNSDAVLQQVRATPYVLQQVRASDGTLQQIRIAPPVLQD